MMNSQIKSLVNNLRLVEIDDDVFTIATQGMSFGCGASKTGIKNIHTYFPKTTLIQPDKVCRSDGDTTFFTTSGVQHIETLLNANNDFVKDVFSIYQPCIRMQFMPVVQEGTSTSFVNFSSVIIGASLQDFVGQTVNFMKLLTDYGMTADSLRINFVERQNNWGGREFNSTVMIVTNNGLEIGESIFMHNFPINDNKYVDIIEIGLGIDRLVWNTGLSKNYLEGFAVIYDRHTRQHTPNQLIAVMDCIRTATLIAGDGVYPSNKNHGYRLRNLLKTFVERNYDTRLDTKELMHLAYQDWSDKGNKFSLDEADTAKIMQAEIDRNYNNFLLKKLKEQFGVESKIDINLPTEQFHKSLRSKLSTEGLIGFNEFFRE